MFELHPVRVLQKQWKSILLGALIGSLLALCLSLLFPLQYRADAGVYIISKSRYGVDPYTVVKSAERVGENLTQVMKTQDFFDKVAVQAGSSLDWSQFQNISERQKLKRWQRTIDASVVFGTGVLNIHAYHKDPGQAKILATSILGALVEQGYEYVGGDVTIKVVNSPIVTRFPVRPNLLVNGLLGLFLGGIVTSGWVILKSRRF